VVKQIHQERRVKILLVNIRKETAAIIGKLRIQNRKRKKVVLCISCPI